MTEIERLAREFYVRIGRGDVEGVLDLMSEDVKWKIPGPPAIPYSGTYQGKRGVRDFFDLLYANEDLQSFVPAEFIVDDQNSRVCVIGSETAKAINTGKTFSAEWAEVFRFRDGLIVEFQEHIDTLALFQAYSSDAK